MQMNLFLKKKYLSNNTIKSIPSKVETKIVHNKSLWKFQLLN